VAQPATNEIENDTVTTITTTRIERVSIATQVASSLTFCLGRSGIFSLLFLGKSRVALPFADRIRIGTIRWIIKDMSLAIAGRCGTQNFAAKSD
jgi:hypothetical protein